MAIELPRLLKTIGMDVETLSSKTQIPQDMWYAYSCDEQKPTIEVCSRVSRLLNIDIFQFFTNYIVSDSADFTSWNPSIESKSDLLCYLSDGKTIFPQYVEDVIDPMYELVKRTQVNELSEFLKVRDNAYSIFLSVKEKLCSEIEDIDNRIRIVRSINHREFIRSIYVADINSDYEADFDSIIDDYMKNIYSEFIEFNSTKLRSFIKNESKKSNTTKNKLNEEAVCLFVTDMFERFAKKCNDRIEDYTSRYLDVITSERSVLQEIDVIAKIGSVNTCLNFKDYGWVSWNQVNKDVCEKYVKEIKSSVKEVLKNLSSTPEYIRIVQLILDINGTNIDLYRLIVDDTKEKIIDDCLKVKMVDYLKLVREFYTSFTDYCEIKRKDCLSPEKLESERQRSINKLNCNEEFKKFLDEMPIELDEGDK